MTTFLKAGATAPQWTAERDLYPAPVDSEESVLALWSDVLVVIRGTASEVRLLLERALELVPVENGNGHRGGIGR